MPTVQALIPETDPLFLGGSSGNGTHPTDSTFGKLKRSRSPPCLVLTNSYDESNMSRRAKTLFQSLSSGNDLSITWTVEHGKLLLEAYYTGDEFVMSDTVLKATFRFIPGNINIGTTLDLWLPLKKKLSNDDINILVTRLLHLFLRVQGSSLGWDAFNTLSSHLVTNFAPRMKMKKWKFLLDLFMIQADVAFTLQRPDPDVCRCLSRVGEALESQGAFEEAAAIYQNIEDLYASTLDERAAAMGNCALAWKRAGNNEVSEEIYVKKLCLFSRMNLLDFADDRTGQVLSNVIILYHDWVYKQAHPDEASEDTDGVLSPCCTLVHCRISVSEY